MLPKVVANIIVVLVSVVWVANFFAQFFVTDYHPDPSINGVFGAIVGTALALTKRQDSPDADIAVHGAHRRED